MGVTNGNESMTRFEEPVYLSHKWRTWVNVDTEVESTDGGPRV